MFLQLLYTSFYVVFGLGSFKDLLGTKPLGSSAYYFPHNKPPPRFHQAKRPFSAIFKELTLIMIISTIGRPCGTMATDMIKARKRAERSKHFESPATSADLFPSGGGERHATGERKVPPLQAAVVLMGLYVVFFSRLGLDGAGPPRKIHKKGKHHGKDFLPVDSKRLLCQLKKLPPGGQGLAGSSYLLASASAVAVNTTPTITKESFWPSTLTETIKGLFSVMVLAFCKRLAMIPNCVPMPVFTTSAFPCPLVTEVAL